MPAPGSSSETSFADLVSRYLDGTAAAAERQTLGQSLLDDVERGREFASQARFESMLRKACRRDVKALFEFAALEAASDIVADPVAVDEPREVRTVTAAAALAVRVPHGAVAPLEPQPQRAVRWRTATTTPWLRIAAVFVALACGIALWFREAAPPQSQITGTTPPAKVPDLQVQSADERQVVLLAPRLHSAAASSITAAPAAAEGPKALTLAERLEDFYLPAVHLHRVRAQDAADWLTAQLRQHNYAKRPDLNQLALRLPPDVAQRLVTLESGPISFKKALEIVTTLAGADTVFTEKGIQVVEHTQPGSQGLPEWQSSPWDKAETQQHASDLGIALDESMLKEEAGGGASLRVPADQRRAFGLLADSQQRLASLAPLSFVPLVVPAGTQRVLTAAEADAIRQRLASGVNAGTVPTVTIPFGAGSQGATLQNGSGNTAVTLTVTPVGEMNQVTIQPATTTPATGTTTNLLADNAATPPPPRADAILDTNQGVITSINADGTTQYYTAEGIPIPPGYEFLYGVLAASPGDSSGSALVLVPVP